jgi:hypothetical protein
VLEHPSRGSPSATARSCSTTVRRTPARVCPARERRRSRLTACSPRPVASTRRVQSPTSGCRCWGPFTAAIRGDRRPRAKTVAGRLPTHRTRLLRLRRRAATPARVGLVAAAARPATAGARGAGRAGPDTAPLSRSLAKRSPAGETSALPGREPAASIPPTADAHDSEVRPPIATGREAAPSSPPNRRHSRLGRRPPLRPAARRPLSEGGGRGMAVAPPAAHRVSGPAPPAG